MHRLEKMNNLAINIFGINIYQGQNKWQHKLIFIEISIKESDRVIDLIIYKINYVLIKKFKVFLGKQDCRYICRRCLNSYTSEKKIIHHRQQCDKKKKPVSQIHMNLVYIGQITF